MSTSYGSIKAQEITTPKLTANSGSGSVRIVCTPATAADLTAEVRELLRQHRLHGPARFLRPGGSEHGLRLDPTALPVTVSGEISKKKVTGKSARETASSACKPAADR